MSSNSTPRRVVRLPFQVIPYGESFYSSQYPSSKTIPEDGAENSQQNSTSSTSTKRPLITPSSSAYELLHLEHLGHRATLSQIKRQYKKQAIRYHPDRFGSDAMFKKIQEAYELLSNENKRRKYDSNDEEFDQFLEDEAWEKQNSISEWSEFDKIFGKYFKMWSKWSETSNVPDFGSEETSYDKVMQYYDFFEKKFVTWRDYACFDDDDEMDPNDADNHDERRWLQQKRKKKDQKRRQNEMKKLRQLVKTARKRDPRIVAHKEALKRRAEEEREKKRRAEELKRRQQYEKEQAILKAKEEEERQKREAKQRQREEKEAYDAAHASHADAIREACAPYIKIGLNKNEIKKMEKKKEHFVLGEDIEMLCMVLNLEQIEKVASRVKELENNPEKMTKALRTVVKQYRQAEDKKREEAQARLKQAKAKREKKKEQVAWTTSELAALAKATKLYPSGTRNRWDCLANHIGTRDAEEVQRKVGELRKGSNPFGKEIPAGGSAYQKPQQDEDPAQWSVSQQKQLENGLRTHRALKGDAKWQQISQGVDNKSAEACKARFKYCKELAKKKKAAS